LLFELHQLNCFVVVAEELHFGKAAARLNMTQPPLSRQIQVLEHKMGVSLFNRSSRSVELTPTGQSFLPEARRIIEAVENAADYAKRIHSGTAGLAKIAFTAATAYGKLPSSFISACNKTMPDVVILLSEMVSSSQIERILSRQIDIGLLRPPITRPELASMPVLSEPLLVALNKNHPLASARSISPEDLHNQPFIMYTPGQARYFYDMLVSLFWAAKVQPLYVQHLSQVHSILALVSGGIGSAIVPASAGSLHYSDITMVPLKSRDKAQTSHAEVHAVWRADNDNPVLGNLIDLLKELSQKVN
jgi:DNA-binding transcriptional LysR family regulator